MPMWKRERDHIKRMEQFVASRGSNNTYRVNGQEIIVSPRTDGKRILNLSFKNLQSITQVEGLIKPQLCLHGLYLDHNQIARIEGLHGAHDIDKIWLDHNQIQKIEGLETLKYLKFVDLAHNRITRIEGLENLDYLEGIRLDGNPIQWPPGLSATSTAKELVAHCRAAAGAGTGRDPGQGQGSGQKGKGRKRVT